MIVLSTWLRYRNHGFLGWARDDYWELETTVAFGVTIGDLAISAFVISTQSLAAWLLLRAWTTRAGRAA